MKIGIDLDNVLNNLNHEWIKTYKKYNNDNITIDDIKCWDIHRHVKIGREIYSYLDLTFATVELQPLKNAIEVTQRLSKHYDLFVVTASSPKHLQTKVNWVNKYFPHIPKDNFITAYRKDLINTDVLIDDAPHNIINFPNTAIVLDYPWNRSLSNTYYRAKDWLEVEQLIKNINQ